MRQSRWQTFFVKCLGGIKSPDIGKLGVSGAYHCPEKQLEGRSVRIEMTSSFIAINIVDLNHAQGEGNVDNDEYEKEHNDVQDHIGHANDYWSGLSPHQADLNRTQKS